MTRQLATITARLAAASVLLLAGTSASAGLIGQQVIGSLYFPVASNNWFNPGFGFVPPGYGNAAGTTVTIGDAVTEYGYEDPLVLVTADFTASQLIVDTEWQPVGYGPAWTMMFTSQTSGLFTSLSLAAQTFDPGLTYGLSGDTIWVQWAGLGSYQNPPPPGGFNAEFSVGTGDPIPEPGTLLLLGAGLAGLAARRRRRDP